MAILIVEQNAKKALQLSHRAYVIQTGTIIMEGKSDDLLHNPKSRKPTSAAKSNGKSRQNSINRGADGESAPFSVWRSALLLFCEGRRRL